MIKTIDQITINGSKKLWNGYIYNFNYEPSFGQTPSYATISLISEDGTYSVEKNDLQVITAHTIQIGNNINLQMYPVEYKKSKSSVGKILEIRYIDTSIILDKKIVVLNGRQGNDGTANSPINIDNDTGKNLSDFTYANDKFVGSCYIPLGKQILKIGESVNNVLEVVYTFTDLCDAIANNGIIINADSYNLVANSNPYYFNNYIGSLRNVLSSWCTDLGLGFYWENNCLHFIDLTTQLILDTSVYDSSVREAETEEVSIEDTVGRVATAFYGRDAFEQQRDASQNTTTSFKCVSMAQVGLTQDQINSVKAAFYGEDFFYAYHFLLNNTYGDSVLAISSREIDVQNNAQGLDPGTHKDSAGLNRNPLYTVYYYVSQDETQKQLNFQAYKNLIQFIGKYYDKPITYGDYKKIKCEFGNPQFFSGLLASSKTMLGDFAASLEAGNESLQGFLLGEPYVSSGPNNQNTGATGNAANQIIKYPYDSQAGFMILDAGNPAWKLDNISVSPEVIAKFLAEDKTAQYYPEKIDVSQDKILPFLKNQNATSNLISQTISPSTYSLLLYGIREDLGNNNLALDIQSPEEISPNLSVNIFIDDKVTDKFTKIEEFFRSETDKNNNTVDCHSNTIKNEMNFRQIDNMDLTALGRPLGVLFAGYGTNIVLPAAPSPKNLDEAFILFSKNLTFSKVDPTVTNTYSFPYIDLPNNFAPLIGKGLINLSIKMDEKGVNSTYTVGTRLMQVPSIETVRTNLEFQRRTNQSRFLPYGYGPYGIK